jgi:hypothetical protein
MGWFKDFFQSTLGSSLIDKFDAGPREAIQVLHRIERMSPTEAVPMLLKGVERHPSDEVRCHCIRALLPYDLSESQIKVITAALDHVSAKVRHVAVSYFGIRGSQGRSVMSVIPKFVRMLEQPDDSTEGDSFEEMSAKIGLPMTIASALKTMVGAEKIIPNYESPDMEEFRAELLLLKNDSDPVLSSDAKKYLRIVFCS